MRRARRIDVWVAGPVIHVAAFFRDSSTGRQQRRRPGRGYRE
jgi:hypothetical protein